MRSARGTTGTWSSWLLPLVAALTFAACGSATRIILRPPSPGELPTFSEAEIEIFTKVARVAAFDFDMMEYDSNTPKPLYGDPAYIVTGHWATALDSNQKPLVGTVHLSVSVNTDRRLVRFVISDIDHRSKTSYVERLESRLTTDIADIFPRAQLSQERVVGGFFGAP